MVHALAVGQGQITGRPGPSPNRPVGMPATVRFWDQTTRYFSVDARRSPDGTYSCVARTLDQPANCTDGAKCQRYVPPGVKRCPDPGGSVPGNRVNSTYTGTYEPTLYAIPGLAARLATDDVGAMRLARLGAVIFGTACVMVAAALLWDRRARGLSFVGLIVALTPMVLYMNGVLNPNGGEMVLTACFFAAVLRVLRGNERASRWTWAALGVSGGLLAVSRPITWLWIAVAAAIALALGARRALAVLRARRPARLGGHRSGGHRPAGRPGVVAVGGADADVLGNALDRPRQHRRLDRSTARLVPRRDRLAGVGGTAGPERGRHHVVVPDRRPAGHRPRRRNVAPARGHGAGRRGGPRRDRPARRGAAGRLRSAHAGSLHAALQHHRRDAGW